MCVESLAVAPLGQSPKQGCSAKEEEEHCSSLKLIQIFIFPSILLQVIAPPLITSLIKSAFNGIFTVLNHI